MHNRDNPSSECKAALVTLKSVALVVGCSGVDTEQVGFGFEITYETYEI